MVSNRLIIVGVLVLAFAGLSASNIFLFNRWQNEKKAAIQAGEKLYEATQDAKQCSDATESLAALAAEQAASSASAVEQAKKTAAAWEARARRQQATPPSVPGDDCKSSAQRLDNWLSERKR